jgi:hypothetical protein
MALRRGNGTGTWQIWVAASALALGCGMLIGRLMPAGQQRWVASITAPPTTPAKPPAPQPRPSAGRPLRDPLAIGPEAVIPEVVVPPPLPLSKPAAPAAMAAMPAVPGSMAKLIAETALPHRSPPRPAPVLSGPVLPASVGSAFDGEAAWHRNAVPAGPEDGRPMIAIVIDDMGLDRRRSDAASALPAPLTLSFMTYAEDLPTQVAAARAHGHEIMMHVPMEPLAANVDPGPNALTVALDQDEIRRRMTWDLGRIDGIVGINNHMGSRFTEWPQGMAPVLEMLRERGLFFLDSRTTPRSVGLGLAAEIGVPHAARDIFLDDELTSPAVAGELARTETVARRNGVAIAIGHPHDPTLTELRRWLPIAEARGFRLVPVSAVVLHNEISAGRETRSTAQD